MTDNAYEALVRLVDIVEGKVESEIGDFVELVADYADIDDDKVAELEAAAGPAAAGNPEGARKVLEGIPFDAVADITSGCEHWTGGLVGHAVAQTSEAWGRDRPSDGLYFEVKLDVPYKVRQAVDAALRDQFGFDSDDVHALVPQDWDTLEWAIESVEADAEFWLADYPRLLEAAGQGRIKRAYKGVHIEDHVSIGELFEAIDFDKSGKRDELRESLAIEWWTSDVRIALEAAVSIVDEDADAIVYVTYWGSDGEVEFDLDDEVVPILKRIGERIDKGERFRQRHTWALS